MVRSSKRKYSMLGGQGVSVWYQNLLYSSRFSAVRSLGCMLKTRQPVMPTIRTCYSDGSSAGCLNCLSLRRCWPVHNASSLVEWIFVELIGLVIFIGIDIVELF